MPSKKKRKWKHGSITDAEKYINMYTIKNPLKCEVATIIKLTGPNSKSEVYHVEINHHQKFHYVEGQSCGVIPYYMEETVKTGNQSEHEEIKDTEKTETKEKEIQKSKISKKARLYSISSSNSRNLAVAVKIHKHYEGENENKIEKYGLCSSFIKSLKINDPIFITGSHGKFVLPDDVSEKNKNLILIGTGTGISPYISFMKKLFGNNEKTISEKEKHTTPKNEATKQMYNGIIHLFYGIYNEDSILYLKDLQYFQKKFPDNVHIHYAFSSMKKNDGSSFYVQDKIMSLQETFWKLFFTDKSELYICGHKNIRGQIWNILKECPMFDQQSKKRIHVEVY